MPLPIPALIALGAELLKVIPWGQKNKTKIEEAAPVLVEIARQVAPGANEQAAVERVLSDAGTREQFIGAVAVKWADLAPLLEYEAKERAAARDFVGEITSGDNWRAIGAGALIGILALTIVVGGGFMFYDFMQSPNVSSDQKSMILGALLTAFSAVIFFFFGSSRSSQMKDAAIADAARGK